MDSGLIHIYTGDGKGKSTAACGLALRAFGAGWRVKIVRFLKSEQSGECKALAMLADTRMEVNYFETPHSFLWKMSETEKENLKEQVLKGYQSCLQAAQDYTCDLLIADEIIGTMHAGFLKEEDLLVLMKTKHPHVELVLTGRNVPDSLLQAADYVSDIRMMKHPYEKGISAREGIEF